MDVLSLKSETTKVGTEHPQTKKSNLGIFLHVTSPNGRVLWGGGRVSLKPGVNKPSSHGYQETMLTSQYNHQKLVLATQIKVTLLICTSHAPPVCQYGLGAPLQQNNSI